jgi:hypothetical protein
LFLLPIDKFNEPRNLMKFPFSKIFRNHKKNIPGIVEKKLIDIFPKAKNIDWERKDELFEAIYYLEEVEHIAQFTETGELIQYKKNLWPDELPEILKTEGGKFGEIMNGIVIYRGTDLFYEMIVRNEKLDRYEFLYDTDGILISSALL